MDGGTLLPVAGARDGENSGFMYREAGWGVNSALSVPTKAFTNTFSYLCVPSGQCFSRNSIMRMARYRLRCPSFASCGRQVKLAGGYVGQRLKQRTMRAQYPSITGQNRVRVDSVPGVVRQAHRGRQKWQDLVVPGAGTGCDAEIWIGNGGVAGETGGDADGG